MVLFYHELLAKLQDISFSIKGNTECMKMQQRQGAIINTNYPFEHSIIPAHLTVLHSINMMKETMLFTNHYFDLLIVITPIAC